MASNSSNRWLNTRLHGAQSPFDQLPSLNGTLAFDVAAKDAAASDYGGHVMRVPTAVLKPGSVQDVVEIVQYAKHRSMKVVMRGRGCSVSGQSLVERGIVVDSRTLDTMRWDGDTIDVGPGASWGEVAERTLERGLTPPVMLDALPLSVGGSLSVGGTGEAGYKLGAQVDHVLELDVVTGHGELVTCSATQNAELFTMTLAGLGQCGIIVRARLRLSRARKYVTLHTLKSSNVKNLLSDLRTFALAEKVDHLAGELVPDSGGWRPTLIIGEFVDEPDAARGSAQSAALRSQGEASLVTMAYRDYLGRRSASIAKAKASGNPNAPLAVLLPADAADSFLDDVLSTSALSTGIWRVEVLPMITARFTRPLFKMPMEATAFQLRLQRRASQRNASDHKAMLTANEVLVQRILSLGGKIYPPFAPILTRDQREQHYGVETWERFTAAKNRFDPNRVLTPGAGLF